MKTFGIFFPGAMGRSVDLYRSKELFKNTCDKFLVLDSIYHLSAKFSLSFNIHTYYQDIAQQVVDSKCKQLNLIVNSNGTIEAFRFLEILIKIIQNSDIDFKKIEFTHISTLWFELPLGDKKLLGKVIVGFYNFVFRRNTDDYHALISSDVNTMENLYELGGVKLISDTDLLRKQRSNLLYTILNLYESKYIKSQIRDYQKGKISLSNLNQNCSPTIKKNLFAFYRTNNKVEKTSLLNFLVYLVVIFKHAYYTKQLFNQGILLKYRSLLDDLKYRGIIVNNNFVFLDRDIWLSKRKYPQIKHNIEMSLEPKYKCNYFYAPNTAHSSIEYFPDIFKQFF